MPPAGFDGTKARTVSAQYFTTLPPEVKALFSLPEATDFYKRFFTFPIVSFDILCYNIHYGKCEIFNFQRDGEVMKQSFKQDMSDSDLSEGLIEGRNAVTEALKSGRAINKLFLADGDTDRSLGRLAAMAKDAGAVVVRIDRRKLNEMSQTGAHQGVIASVAAHEYSTIDEILAIAESRGEAPLLVLCDELSDPHNLGAILRTAECAGAHGIVIPKRRSVGLTAVVGKASAGAVEYIPVARVANLTAAVRDLKSRGVWIFGTAADGSVSLYDADLKRPAAIVIGNEGDGISRLVRENCDYLVSIPMKGHVSSLNASASTAILLYEALRQRG